MNTKNIEIRGGRVVDPASQFDDAASVFVADGKIAGIGQTPAGFKADQVIEAKGLLRIKSYVGRSAPLKDYTQARAALAKTHGASFPALDDADWDMFARATWNVTDQGLVLSYDPQISESLKDYDPDQPAPDLWPLWNALAQAPCLIIRGELSDLFTQETAKKMAQGHQHCTIHTVAGQGHAPLLRDQPTMEAIARFIEAGE